jgi:hypothetical protein
VCGLLHLDVVSLAMTGVTLAAFASAW